MAGKQNKKTAQKPVAPNKISPQNSTQQKQSMASNGKFSLNQKLALLLGFISFIVYANTLKNGFVLDDSSVITKNTIVSQGISAIPEILSTPYRHGFQISINDLYRPLTLVIFAIQYQFFGTNPMPYHFFNVLLFAGCVIMLFFSLDKLFERKKTAIVFLASLLFALNPIHTEIVANIKSCDELLCFFFAFLSLYVFIDYLGSGKTSQLLLGTSCFFLSLLSKETVITFLVIIPLIFCFYKNENRKRGIYITISAAVVAMIFLAIRFAVLTNYHANSIAAIDIVDNALSKPDLSYASRIATAILILGYYIKLLIVPFPLISDYSYNTIPFVNFSDPVVLISLAFYIFLAAFGVRRFIKNNADPYALWIFFFLITISLFSNIPFLIGATMGERFVFFPSVSFCIIIALLIDAWLGTTEKTTKAILKMPKVLGVIIPVSVIYGIIVINRNTDWLSNYTLYAADVKKAPESAKLNYWLGLELELTIFDEEKDHAKQKQIIDEATMHLRKALAIRPEFTDAQITIGHAYGRNAQYDSAEYHDKMAIQLDPRRADPINNLASVYFHKGQYPLAIEYCKKTIEVNPNFVTSYANLAACYGTLGKFDSCIYYAYRAIQIDPTFPLSYEVLAATFKIIGQPDSSRKYEAIAHKNNPNFKL